MMPTDLRHAPIFRVRMERQLYAVVCAGGKLVVAQFSNWTGRLDRPSQWGHSDIVSYMAVTGPRSPGIFAKWPISPFVWSLKLCLFSRHAPPPKNGENFTIRPPQKIVYPFRRQSATALSGLTSQR